MTTLAMTEAPTPQFQVINLTGRLTQDVELRERGETKVAQLRLAVPRGRDKNGEDRGADFVDVVCFGRQAEVCANYLGKGRRIAVEGRLHHDEWDSENGRHQKLEVIARTVEFLDPRKTDDNGSVAEEGADTPAAF
jgi:single-strand DNA-binding protein